MKLNIRNIRNTKMQRRGKTLRYWLKSSPFTRYA